MPIYEYGCETCGHELEAFQKMADDPLRDCPACGSPSLKRKISAVGFRLKGGGWYETDFKSSDKKKNLANEDTTPADSGKSTADSGKSSKAENSGTSDTAAA